MTVLWHRTIPSKCVFVCPSSSLRNLAEEMNSDLTPFFWTLDLLFVELTRFSLMLLFLWAIVHNGVGIRLFNAQPFELWFSSINWCFSLAVAHSLFPFSFGKYLCLVCSTLLLAFSAIALKLQLEALASSLPFWLWIKSWTWMIRLEKRSWLFIC